jgi:hypothetical protein
VERFRVPHTPFLRVGSRRKVQSGRTGTRLRGYSNEIRNRGPRSKLPFETITMEVSYRQSDHFMLISPVKPALQFEIQYEKRPYEKCRHEKRCPRYSSPAKNFLASPPHPRLPASPRVAIGRQFHPGPRHISPMSARTERNTRDLSPIVSCKYERLFSQHPCFDRDANAWGVLPNRLLKLRPMHPKGEAGRNSRW